MKIPKLLKAFGLAVALISLLSAIFVAYTLIPTWAAVAIVVASVLAYATCVIYERLQRDKSA